MFRALWKHPFASLVLIAGVAVAGVLLYWQLTSPKAVYQRILSYGEKGQYDKIWDHVDKRSQDMLTTAGSGFEALIGSKQTEEERSEKGRALFVKLCQTARDFGGQFKNRHVKSVSVNGDRATLTVIEGDEASGRQTTVEMVKEDGAWKITLPSLGRSMIPGLSF